MKHKKEAKMSDDKLQQEHQQQLNDTSQLMQMAMPHEYVYEDTAASNQPIEDGGHTGASSSAFVYPDDLKTTSTLFSHTNMTQQFPAHFFMSKF
jgi:hypothetical protein